VVASLALLFASLAAHAPCEPPPSDMACVAGGQALVGDDKRTMDIATFYIDLHEITHADYAACVKAGACKALDIPPINQRIMIPFMGDTQPAMPLDWFRADAYCAWRGKRLPDEWEWEKAARGPDGDVYPWGNDPPSCDKAQYRECAPKGCTPYRGKKHAWDCVEHATKPVGSYAAGHYGLFDMAGNGYEWTSSAASAAESNKRVLRGGSWYWPAAHIKASHRRVDRPSTGHHRLSARCASSGALVR
jgi:formylglycine-generating enzyme required for sulfatase activity